MTRWIPVTTAMVLLSCGEIDDRGDCDEYLDCIEPISDGMTFDLLEKEYGPGGTCWTEGKDFAQACRDACEVGLSACDFEVDTDTDTDTDSDTDTDTDVDTLIQTIAADCNSTKWWFEAETSGWTSDGAVDLAQTAYDPSWEEAHDLTSVDYGDDWDRVRTDLPIVTDWSQQSNNVNTLIECSGTPKSTMTWMIRVWDPDGVMSDCAVWGEDVSFYAEYGCLNWN